MMEMDVQLSTESNSKSNFRYFLTISGWLRIANLLLGILSIIFASIGFQSDFPRDENWGPYLYYYGLGYNEERANLGNLIIVCICFITSAFFCLIMMCNEGSVEEWKAWNRFLHLSLAFFLLIGWFCGFMGLTLFRQGCCRVEAFSNERISNELEGYSQSCLCYMRPHVDPDHWFAVLKYQDAEPQMRFVSIQPHHFNEHVANLVFTLANVCVYFVAVFKVK